MGMSLKERDHRYSAIRNMMRKDGLDCLVIASRDTHSTRGNTRYVANYGNYFGEEIVMFPADGDPSIICSAQHGPSIERGGWVKNLVPDGDYHQNTSHQVEQVKKELARLDKGNKIGIVGRTFISVPVYLAVMEQCPNRAVDAVEIFNQLRDMKSPEEIEAIRTAALIADKVYIHIKNLLRPSLSDFKIYSEAKALIYEMGCEYSMELSTGLPYGRIFGANDIVGIEFTPAYDGYYVQLATNMPIAGEYSASTKKVIDIWEEALAAGVKNLRPGKKVSEVHQAVSTVLRQRGDTRAVGRIGHNIGLDVIDSWEVISTNTTELKSGMTLAFHPSAALDGVRFSGGYTYLITATGAEKLNKVSF
jgi:Xaa-Pro aminopeptidase